MSQDSKNAARQLVSDTLVWDAHSGFEAWPDLDLSQLKIWKNAGVDFLSVNVGYDLQTLTDTIRAMATFRRWFSNSGEFELVTTPAEAQQAKANGRMAIAFDLEGLALLNGSLDVLHLLHELGVRQAALAYNRNNDIGGGCHDDDRGLTAFGRTVVAEMHRLGMFVDCSHCGYRTTMDVMELGGGPVIFFALKSAGLTRPRAQHCRRTSSGMRGNGGGCWG